MARAAEALPAPDWGGAGAVASIWPTAAIGLVLTAEVAAEVFLVPDAGRAATQGGVRSQEPGRERELCRAAFQLPWESRYSRRHILPLLFLK